MIGLLNAYAGLYLQVLGLGSILLLGAPLVVAPLAWGRAIRRDSKALSDPREIAWSRFRG
ncbi:MAG TPA: hypothetical protein VEX41_01760 [Candidatus Eisenbacteria bacterium]|nr:hypothetical protein [Candidatus Eisenbacteria bacterium]